MLDLGKNLLITSSNQKQNVHYINLLKLVPKMKSEKKYKYKQPIFKSRNIKIFFSIKTNNESKKDNDESQVTDKISQIDMSSFNNNSLKTSLSQKKYQKIETNNIQTKNKNDYPYDNNTQTYKEDKNLTNDRVFSFFNRHFYDSEIPLSKKTELNQKILNYYLQDKENKEKLQRSKFEKFMSKKYRHNNHKNMSIFNQKKNDIKTSLILNDFSMYHKIHRIVRFWGKFTNYVCPLFQVQKFSLSNKKKKEEKMNFSWENNNSDKIYLRDKKYLDKNIRLPVLYTNSSRTIEKLGIKKNKTMAKNRSDLDLNELYSNNIKILNNK